MLRGGLTLSSFRFQSRNLNKNNTSDNDCYNDFIVCSRSAYWTGTLCISIGFIFHFGSCARLLLLLQSKCKSLCECILLDLASRCVIWFTKVGRRKFSIYYYVWETSKFWTDAVKTRVLKSMFKINRTRKMQKIWRSYGIVMKLS